MNADQISLVNAIIAALTLVVTVFVVHTSFKFRKQFSTNEKLQNYSSIVIEKYIDKPLPQPLKIDNEEIFTVSELRHYIKDKYEFENNNFQKDKVEIYNKVSLISSTPENILAYELSIRLEEIGVMVFNDMLPLNVLLATHSRRMSEDWIFCNSLINDRIRLKNPMCSKNKSGLKYYHRIYAEWIVALSTIYLLKYWESDSLDRIIKLVGYEKCKEIFDNYKNNRIAIRNKRVYREARVLLE